MSDYKNPVCRGSWALGSACGRCERCEETRPDAKPKNELAPMELEKGLVNAKDTAQMLRFCDGMIRAGMTPKRFKTPQEVMGAVLYVRSLGLPDGAIRQVANVEGTPTIYGDLPLALVQVSGELEWIKEFLFDEEYREISFANKNLHVNVFGAFCQAKRKDKPLGEPSYFTMKDAKDAGLIKPNSNYEKYPKDMLTYRARGRQLKSVFPDKINGVAIAEYDFAMHPNEIKDVTPRPNINDMIGVSHEQSTDRAPENDNGGDI